jgi:excisionase family DNA binding protein
MLLTVKEVADHYRVSQDTVRKWIREKRIEYLNVGRGKRATYRIPKDAVLGRRVARPIEEIV